MACMGSSRQPISRRCPESNKSARDCRSTHKRGITQAQTHRRTHPPPPPPHTHTSAGNGVLGDWALLILQCPAPARHGWSHMTPGLTISIPATPCSGSTPGRSWLQFSASASGRGPSHAALPRTAAPVISHMWSRQGPPRSARGNMGPTCSRAGPCCCGARGGILFPGALRDMPPLWAVRRLNRATRHSQFTSSPLRGLLISPLSM